MAHDTAARQHAPAPDERMRTELEMIAHAASHDLQTPLRIIQRCCEMLQTQPGDAQALAALAAESARMQAQMQGLLDYLRLELFTPPMVDVDANTVVADAIASLEAPITESAATLACDLLPVVHGHRARLTRLFTLLLENALKFRGDAAPTIRIGAQRKGAMWEFCVEDNGPGIGDEYREIIFTLYFRLPDTEHLPGQGIGLAIARRIVESHGGAMWLEPQETGCCICFTLPAQS
jgi:light-regulated signal transduction histidine kinase (bacteriophytochrome)